MFVAAQPDSNHVHKGALGVFLLWGGSLRLEEKEVLSPQCVQGCPGLTDTPAQKKQQEMTRDCTKGQ